MGGPLLRWLRLRTLLLVVALATLSALHADAAVRRLVDVSYYVQDYSLSEPHVMEVTFATGKELNKSTKSYDYDGWAKYALVWFGESEVAIIELETFVMIGDGSFDADDFRRAFQFNAELDGKQVNSESPRRWKLSAKRGFKWIDPRIN